MRIFYGISNSAGDVALSSAVLKRLKEIYPGSRITYGTTRYNAAIARSCPFVDEVCEFPDSNRYKKWFSRGEVEKFISRDAFDLFFYPQVFPEHLYLMKRENVLSAQFRLCGIDPPEPPYRVALSVPENGRLEPAIEGGRKVLVIGTSAKSMRRPHPTRANWMMLIGILRRRGWRILHNVAAGEKALPGTEALCCSYDEFLRIVSKAGFFLGLRSGLCDLAVATRALVIALHSRRKFLYGRPTRDVYSFEAMGVEGNIVELDLGHLGTLPLRRILKVLGNGV